jgi:hypothetical protein
MYEWSYFENRTNVETIKIDDQILRGPTKIGYISLRLDHFEFIIIF